MKLFSKFLFVDIERCLKVLDSLNFDAENYFDDSKALHSTICLSFIFTGVSDSSGYQTYLGTSFYQLLGGIYGQNNGKDL